MSDFEITPDLLLRAYASGVFPMAETRNSETQWVDPAYRGILPLDRFHISRSLRKFIHAGEFSISVNTAFDAVVSACADRDETWINPEITKLYSKLHEIGHAHSVEYRIQGTLMGGLFGISLAGAFFGESMFSRSPNASKIALTWLIARLRTGGFSLCDTQFITPHLQTMGGTEISRAQYHVMLSKALKKSAYWDTLPSDSSSDEIMQRVTQMS